MSTALATLTSNFASRFGIGVENQQELMTTLKATAFKGNVTDAQMTALMLVAQQYGLNPWTREIYAFPDKNNGIVPVVGVDGWSRIMNEHPQFDGMEFQQDTDSCTCIIYRKDRSHPISATEYMEECRRNVGPWQSHPKRMLRHKAMIQAARLAFGFVGIYEQDEAERILEGNVSSGGSNRRPTPQSITDANVVDGYNDYELENLPGLAAAANSGGKALESAFKALEKSQHKAALWTKHSAALKETAASADFVSDIEDAEVIE